MEEKNAYFQRLDEALEAVGMRHFYRESLYIKPGQSWTVMEEGVSMTITRQSDGLYCYPLIHSQNHYKNG